MSTVCVREGVSVDGKAAWSVIKLFIRHCHRTLVTQTNLLPERGGEAKYFEVGCCQYLTHRVDILPQKLLCCDLVNLAELDDLEMRG